MLIQANASMRSCAVIEAQNGFCKSDVMLVNMVNWYTKFAAVVLSLGMFNFVFMNHNPIVSDSKRTKPESMMYKFRHALKLRFKLSTLLRPKSNVINL